MDSESRSPARLLAPIALVAFTLALVVVIAGSFGSDDTGDGGNADEAAQQQEPADEPNADDAEAEPDDSDLPRFYRVETGDTLAGIAADHGLTVERLQELNPELDPQAMVSGQRIRLKE